MAHLCDRKQQPKRPASRSGEGWCMEASRMTPVTFKTEGSVGLRAYLRLHELIHLPKRSHRLNRCCAARLATMAKA